MNPNTIQNMAAAPGTLEAYAFVEKFNDVILYPLIILLTGVAFLVFLYGCLMYIINAENSHAREEGRSHIIYSLLGMFVMLVAYAILQIAAGTFGVEDVLNCVNKPDTAGCDNVLRVPGGGGTPDGGVPSDGTPTGGVPADGTPTGGVPTNPAPRGNQQ
jgi:hypothetical protein